MRIAVIGKGIDLTVSLALLLTKLKKRTVIVDMSPSADIDTVECCSRIRPDILGRFSPENDMTINYGLCITGSTVPESTDIIIDYYGLNKKIKAGYDMAVYATDMSERNAAHLAEVSTDSKSNVFYVYDGYRSRYGLKHLQKVAEPEGGRKYDMSAEHLFNPNDAEIINNFGKETIAYYNFTSEFKELLTLLINKILDREMKNKEIKKLFKKSEIINPFFDETLKSDTKTSMAIPKAVMESEV